MTDKNKLVAITIVGLCLIIMSLVVLSVLSRHFSSTQQLGISPPQQGFGHPTVVFLGGGGFSRKLTTDEEIEADLDISARRSEIRFDFLKSGRVVILDEHMEMIENGAINELNDILFRSDHEMRYKFEVVVEAASRGHLGVGVRNGVSIQNELGCNLLCYAVGTSDIIWFQDLLRAGYTVDEQLRTINGTVRDQLINRNPESYWLEIADGKRSELSPNLPSR